ncbi:MAG TPA: hypothetical protein PLQ49_08110, partial [Methanothrix sp.]|nr:hypothetical protein [Methanothrix sp.]
FIYSEYFSEYLWSIANEIWRSLWFLGRIDPPDFISIIIKEGFIILLFLILLLIFYLVLHGIIYLIKIVRNKLKMFVSFSYLENSRASIAKKMPLMFILMILILLSSLSFANYMGKYNAEKLIEGKGNYLEINLQPRGTLPEGPLILVMYIDNKYYVLEKKEDAQNNITLYIVRDEIVEKAEIKKDLSK